MKLIILGAGGYGQTIADVASQSKKYKKIVFLDDNSTDPSVIGKCSDFLNFISPRTEIYPAFGNNQVRLDWIQTFKKHQIRIPTFIHTTAYISPSVTIGVGSVVLPNAVVNTNCIIKEGCIINCGAIIDHGCVIENGVHICLGAIIKAENKISMCNKIEAGDIVQLRTHPV